MSDAEESLARGLAQSAAGEVTGLGSFAQYADDSAWLDRDNKPLLESLRDRLLQMRPWSDDE